VRDALQHGLVLDAIVLLTVLLALAYHTRVSIPRPPVGRFVGSDVLVMVVLLVVMPFAYLHLPEWIVAAVFGITTFVIVQLTLSPIAGGRRAGALAGVLCAADLGFAIAGWSTALLTVNGLLVATLTVGVVNIWVQTGMTAGHIALFAAALTGYDTLATAASTLTSSFVEHLDGLPYAPMLVVGQGAGAASIGLGDCLLLAVWPLVAYRTYGRAAGLLAVIVDVALLAGLFTAFATGVFTSGVPVLTVLGPLIVAQYFCWRRSMRLPDDATRDYLARAAWRSPDGAGSDDWIAVHDDVIVGSGPTPATAYRAARRAGHAESDLVVLGRRPA
jgi:hypothetical protein